jgi:PAS domain S-box-containing protein
MNTQGTTNGELINELERLRRRVAELEESEAGLKGTERLLKETEERFRSLYENAPLGYQSLDEDGHFLEVNQAWLDTLGYSRKEVIGKWFGDFLAPGYQEHFRINFPKFKAAGEIHGVEFEMLRKDGSQISVALDGHIGRDEQGRFKQTHCILHDVTERKREQAIMQALLRLREYASSHSLDELLCTAK